MEGTLSEKSTTKDVVESAIGAISNFLPQIIKEITLAGRIFRIKITLRSIYIQKSELVIDLY